jgi:hypothetical protein
MHFLSCACPYLQKCCSSLTSQTEGCIIFQVLRSYLPQLLELDGFKEAWADIVEVRILLDGGELILN